MLVSLLKRLSLVLFLALLLPAGAEEVPALLQENGKFSFHVNGKPFLVLAVQINNSSAWPSMLPDVWPLIDTLPVNTVEAPVYWEQMEPRQGEFDFTSVDALVTQARQHHIRLILSWFGTWKNGKMHYVPEWIKTNPQKYPRVVDETGKRIDVLSAHSTMNLEADKAAFIAFVRHLKEIDGLQHTVIMLQVENEPGIIGSAKDYSPEAEAEYARGIPAELTAKLGEKSGSWSERFGGDGAEAFEAYSVAHYIEQIASAGKKIMDLPYYVNVWQHYPFAKRYAGVSYPTGGATHPMLDLWHAAAPSIDMYAPDIYAEDIAMQRKIMDNYKRPYNPVWICESDNNERYAQFFYSALGRGAIGVATFGVDMTGWSLQSMQDMQWFRDELAPLLPMSEQLAGWNAQGLLQTSVERPGETRQILSFTRWDAVVDYGTYDSEHLSEQPSGTKAHMGRLLVAQSGPDEFVVTGIDSTVQFRLHDGVAGDGQILSVEEGQYVHGVWVRKRIWNGDQTDYGMHFKHQSVVLKIRMGIY